MATAQPSDSERDLTSLRSELDKIDAELLDVLRERIEVCVRIARYKSDHDMPMMQPQRIEVVQQRAAHYGEQHGIDTDFLRKLYDIIIEETCRVEDLVIGDPVISDPAVGDPAVGDPAISDPALGNAPGHRNAPTR